MKYQSMFAFVSNAVLCRAFRMNSHLVRTQRFSSTAALFAGKTMFDKIWESHLVDDSEGNSLIYIDRHLVHEVTSPQAFEGLRTAGRPVRRPDCTLVTVDHNVPTSDRSAYTDAASFIQEDASRAQVLALEENIEEFGLTYFGMDDQRQGIVHIIGPEQGFTLPGSTIVCGDSHTATHGAFGALAFGIGTSEVEHVLATQCLVQSKAKNMLIRVDGHLPPGVTSKDLILHVIGRIGTAGGTGHVMEFAGDAIRDLSMEARMSICNMAIEAGARAGMIAPDEKTFEYLRGRPMAPKADAFEQALAYWRTLTSDSDASFDTEVIVKAAEIAPTVTWGTSPQDAVSIGATVPDPADMEATDPGRATSMRRSLDYMGLEPGTPLEGLKVDKVFIGSCTNGRIEDLRAAAAIAKGRTVSDHVYAMIVPGSGLVKAQAEMEGLDKIFVEAGFDWREPGCSMCLAMNPDQLKPQERCASTSNRNFEGRQGSGGRTHLVSPAMAVAAAVTGHLTDVRNLSPSEIPAPVDDPLAIILAAAASSSATASANNVVKTAAAKAAAAPAPAAAVAAAASDPTKVFKQIKGKAAKIEIQNIDTDMIIPKQYLKTIKRSGLGKFALNDLRYINGDPSREDPDFILNREGYRDAPILVVGDNFGCGSSREHAPWALRDAGVRVIISTAFADIFYNNCFKNGMLPIVLPQSDVDKLMADADLPGAKGELAVDLESCTITRADGESVISFEIDPFRRECLLGGLDDIGLTMQRAHTIDTFEKRREAEQPWLNNAAQEFVAVA